MTDAPNKLVIFDCDGTLSDGQHMIIDAMHHCFDAKGLARANDDTIRSIIGLSLKEAMEKIVPTLSDNEHLELVEQYKTSFLYLRSSGAFQTEPLYDGTKEVLQHLDEAGYLLAVATGKSMRGLKRVLANHDLDHFFISLQTADHHPSKPHPSMIQTAIVDAGSAPEHTVMIGDTSFDMTMARNANAHAIGVNWGYHDHSTLIASGAAHLADRFHDLPDLIDGLIGFDKEKAIA